MDAPPRTSSKHPPPSQNAAPLNPRALSYTGGEESSRVSAAGRRSEGALRREHSDGEVFAADFESRPRVQLFQGTRHGATTGMSLSRGESPPLDADDILGPGLASAGRRERAAQILADRMKRMSRHQEEHVRRRSSSNLSIGQAGEARQRSSFAGPSNERPLIGASISPGNPFLPRDLNRPLPRRPTEEDGAQNRRSQEIVLPRWQADAEVTECPICHATFSFWYRKHHCRKCGRVVCANCSPHRITIPRQFIVHAPDEAQAAISPTAVHNPGPAIVDLNGDDEAPPISADDMERPRTADYRVDSGLGGGQEVRLCNPCVPDPNPLPPPSYYSQRRSLNAFQMLDRLPDQADPSSSEHMRSMDALRSQMLNRSHSERSQHRPRNTFDSDPSVTTPYATAISSITGPSSNHRHRHDPRPPFSPADLPPVYGSAPDSSARERYLESLAQRQRHAHHSHRQHASLGGAIPGHPRVSWSQDMNPLATRPVPQTQLREEDECPICHGALPSKGTGGSEVAREAHVENCIATHFSSSTPRASQPAASVAIAAAVTATAAAPSEASGIRGGHRTSATSQDRPSSSFLQQRRRTVGMVVYPATEKDCVGENGEGEAECVICFEEFAVGDEMGRLECLCKFHRTCIRQWWDTKGPGACPVHQQQEEA